MANELVERAASAAYEECMVSYAQIGVLPPHLERQVKEPPWQHLSDDLKDHWRRVARAVIGAAREPTTAMVETGRQFRTRHSIDVTQRWKAMIDAALEDHA